MSAARRPPPSNLVACRPAHLVYLAHRMRADEIDQYLALTGAERYDPDVAVRGFINIPGPAKFTVVDRSGAPVVAGGFEEVIPGVWQSWMVGTDEGWAENWRSITKATRWLMDELLAGGARRLQTTALANREAAIHWYTNGLGMHQEGRWKNYGRNGEDVVQFARLGG